VMACIITQSGALMTFAVDNLPLTGFAMAGEKRADEEALGALVGICDAAMCQVPSAFHRSRPSIATVKIGALLLLWSATADP
jgi:hypothetical protein